MSVREIGFDRLRKAQEKVSQTWGYISWHDRFWLFVAVNILLYWLLVWLSIFRLFGLV